MVKIPAHFNISNFKYFLEKEVLKTKISFCKPLDKGGASFNFLIKYHHSTHIVQIFLSEKVIAKVHRTMPILKHINQSLPKTSTILHHFTYQHYQGIVKPYIEGNYITSYLMSKKHFIEVLSFYQQFRQINIDKTIPIPPPTNYHHYYLSSQKLLQHKRYLLKQKNFFFQICFSLLFHKIQQHLLRLEKNLAFSPSSLTIIHGDFHNNNVLFKNNILCGVLDWIDARQGHTAEDLSRFGMSAMARLPIWFPGFWWLKRWIKTAQAVIPLSKKEWAFGLATCSIDKIRKVLNYQYFNFRYFKSLIGLIHFLYIEKKVLAFIYKKYH